MYVCIPLPMGLFPDKISSIGKIQVEDIQLHITQQSVSFAYIIVGLTVICCEFLNYERIILNFASPGKDENSKYEPVSESLFLSYSQVKTF